MTLFSAKTDQVDTKPVWSLGKQLVMISGIAVVYFGVTLRLASTKPLWSDEFFTLYLARLPTLNDLWTALSTGADQHPPLFYLLSRLSLWALGENALAVRIPAILGFWLFCLALYFLVGRNTSPWFGAIAMVFPMSTLGYQYAYEARGYGPVLGFSAWALLCWTHVRTPRLRPWAILGLALFLAAAVGCHYYAVMLLLPLGVGETTYSVRARKLDPWVWLGFAGIGITLATSWHFIASARTFAPAFWARPNWGDAFWYWQNVLGPAQVPLFVVLCIWLGIRAMSPPNAPGNDLPADTAPQRDLWPEMAAVWCLLALPLLVMIGAKVTTGAFHFRYVLFALLGPCILFPWALHRISRRRELVGAIALALMVLWFYAQGLSRIGDERTSRRAINDDAEWLLEHNPERLPLVLARNDLWYRQSYYGPSELKRQIIYLAAPERARQLLGHDTVDRCALTLQPWFRLPLANYQVFLDRTDRFLLFTDADTYWNWQLTELVDGDLKINIVARHGSSILCEVTRQLDSVGQIVEH